MARGRRWLGLGLLAGLASLVAAGPAAANTTSQALPFTQSWTNTGLITVADNWDAVPGIVGYRGDGLTTATAVDPQTVVSEGTPVVDVNPNVVPTTFATGGVAEFDGLADPVVAIQGSGTARAPSLVLYLDTSGLTAITVAYTLRDIDGSDNAVQPVALQYRVGVTGDFTNVPAGFVADATAGPLAPEQPVTPVSVALPPAANNEPNLQVRILTTDAVGSDEWVGVDDITVTAGTDTAPAVQSTTPADGATGVAADVSPTVTFTEPVDLAAGAFALTCATSGAHALTVSGGPTTFTLDPDGALTAGETCTLATTAAAVTDQDALDPPDAMAADSSRSFTVAAPVVTADVVISEVFGGGGNQGAPFTNDFIELRNREGTAVDLDGWSIQYASATGGTWSVTPLQDDVPAGRNYLVAEGGGTTGAPLPTPDASGTILMSAQNGKVALVASTTPLTGTCPVDASIVDLVGYGPTASCSETAPTPVLSSTTAALRKGDGTVDTDDNSADFDIGAPDPHSTADPAPTVQSTMPASGTIGVVASTDVTVTFSEPVDLAADAITIDCATSGPHPAPRAGGPTTFTLDPATDLAAGEQCTIAVAAADVSDQDVIDPPDTMAADFTATFTVADPAVCGTPATGIHDVQGAGAASPIAGQTVTVEGVVVGDYQGPGEFGGFYVQEEADDVDSDPTTSEGLFVFSSLPAAAGDVVRVTGRVLEFNDLTELSPVTGVQVCASGATVAPTAFPLPFGSAADEEALEGMLVTLDQTLTATEVFNLGRFGEVSLSGVGRLYTPTAVATPGAAAQTQLAENARSRIVLDDGVNDQNIDPTRYPQGGLSASNTLRVGDTLPGLTGVMDFRFSAYRIQPIGPLTWSHDNARTPAPEPVGGNLKVASFNVLNYFNGDGLGGGFPTPRGANTPEEFARQRAKIVSAITALDGDIVGLMEIENDAPPNSALEDLVAGLNASAGAGTYAFVDTGVIGTDEIKVALIYKPASVSPIGAFATITSAVDPRFVDTLNRPSLAQTFQRADGARLTVVVNHLKSKGSDCNAVGDPDTGDGQGNCNITRTNAAAALVDWLAGDPTGSGDPDVLLIGDMNSYTFEDPITTFVDGGFVNLVRQFGGLTPYSYVFNGESGYLDHALASPSLAAQATGTADWHINPDEPTVLDYNVEFKTPNQVTTFYDPGPYRASDHDPVVIGLGLAGASSVEAGGPYAVDEGGSVDVSATGSGGTSYAWDLDGDGTFETTGQTATFSAAALDGPATRTIAVRLSGPGGAATDEATVEVANVAPTVAVAGPATAVIGAATTWRFTTTDPAPADQAAGFTLRVDWGDGTPVQVVTGTSPQDVAHTYVTAGGRTISVTATDDDGGTSDAATAAVTAFGAALQPDVCTPGRQALVVVGTGAADQIALRPASGGRVEVRFGGASVGTFAPTGQLVVSGLGGGDGITIDAALARQAIVYGGAGGDTLRTGSGSATLVGGAGADTLSSGAGRDVLIGGGDGDTLGGGNGDDIMVAGTTSYDAETPASQRALCAIAAEWNRPLMPYLLRIGHLTGVLPGGLNGNAELVPVGSGRTVFDDGAVDRLTGGNADDWFLLNVTGAGARDTSDRRLLEIALDT